jgi:BirA family biotin operon repressor/biotin-[acetyl-CoA-carboxylase] ligase
MMTMKGKILKLLKNRTAVISGEALSRRLGLSRVSIWKHIQGLKGMGYEIDATTKGYRLVKSPDIPFAWEFPNREDRIHFFERVPSTMGIARDMARKGCPEMTVVVAGTQTKGRGRMDRFWRSGKGGLYFSLVLRPAVAPINGARVNLYAANILAKTLRDVFGIDAGVKWPNDILVDGKKVSGLLSEMEAEFDRVTYMNVGIGINVNNDPTHAEPGATSLKRLLGRSISLVDLLASFLDAFEASLSMALSRQVIDQWKQFAVTLNRSVKVVTPRTVTEGVAVDIDENGGLIIRKNDGSFKTVVYGDCFLGDKG